MVLHYDATGACAQAAAMAVHAAGGRAVAVQADLCTPEGAQSVAAAGAALGGGVVDVLVHSVHAHAHPLRVHTRMYIP